MDHYVKEDVLNDLSAKEKKLQLMQCILNTQKDLKQSHINFEFAEEDLVDFFSYEIKANQAKLDYLTRLAKINNVKNSLSNNLAV